MTYTKFTLDLYNLQFSIIHLKFNQEESVFTKKVLESTFCILKYK